MSLVELIVVLGIVGIVVGMSVPGFAGAIRQLRLRTTTRQVLGLLSLARSTAISAHEEQAVVIDLERRDVRVITVRSGEALEKVVSLPATVSIELKIGGESIPDLEIVFLPTGSLKGRTVSVVLSDREQSKTILVTGPTGAISLQGSS